MVRNQITGNLETAGSLAGSLAVREKQYTIPLAWAYLPVGWGLIKKKGKNEMGIYLIGYMFTYGYLICIDEKFETKKFNGFKGGLKLFFICLIWPFTIGHLIAHINTEDD